MAGSFKDEGRQSLLSQAQNTGRKVRMKLQDDSDTKAAKVDTHHGGSFRSYMRQKRIKGLMQQRQGCARVSNLFSGLVFYINGYVDFSGGVEGLEKLIVSHGGSVVPTQLSSVDVFIASQLSESKVKEIKNTRKKKRVEYVLWQWIVESIAANSLLPYDKFCLPQLKPKGVNPFAFKYRNSRPVSVCWSNMLQAAVGKDAAEADAVAFRNTILWLRNDSLKNTNIRLGMSKDLAVRCAEDQKIVCCDEKLLKVCTDCFNSAIKALSRRPGTGSISQVNRSEYILKIDESVDLLRKELQSLLRARLPEKCSLPVVIKAKECKDIPLSCHSSHFSDAKMVYREFRDGYLQEPGQPRAALHAMVSTFFLLYPEMRGKNIYDIRLSVLLKDLSQLHYQWDTDVHGLANVSDIAMYNWIHDHVSKILQSIQGISVMAIPSKKGEEKREANVVQSFINVKKRKWNQDRPKDSAFTKVAKNMADVDSSSLIDFIESHRNDLGKPERNHISQSMQLLVKRRRLIQVQRVLRYLDYALRFEQDYITGLDSEFVSHIRSVTQNEIATVMNPAVRYVHAERTSSIM